LKILYVEPFYSGAHKQWIDNYKKISKHNITIINLSGKKWKWRMHGGAITLAEKFNNLNQKFDLIICSDMLNLPVFKSLCNKELINTRIVIYFHENQFSYPWSQNDPDIKLNRDLHYGYINYTSSLVADHNYFNSNYNLDSYIDGLKKYLNKMPNNKNLNSISDIKNKSSVLYIGCNLKEIKLKDKNKSNKYPIVLWNHRWEYDKKPDIFFDILYKLKDEGLKFSVIILGKQYKEYPECFDKAKKILKNEILHIGYSKSTKDYKKWLNVADILPVTSIQDFFGISIVEAVASGVYPILPNRLSYPEILNKERFPEIFYNSDAELFNKIYYYFNHYKVLRKSISKYKNYINRFDWSNMVNTYDEIFEQKY